MHALPSCQPQPDADTAVCYLSDLTNAYQTLVVALSFPKPKTEEDIPFSVDLDTLPPEDKERLLKPQKKPSQ